MSRHRADVIALGSADLQGAFELAQRLRHVEKLDEGDLAHLLGLATGLWKGKPAKDSVEWARLAACMLIARDHGPHSFARLACDVIGAVDITLATSAQRILLEVAAVPRDCLEALARAAQCNPTIASAEYDRLRRGSASD